MPPDESDQTGCRMRGSDVWVPAGSSAGHVHSDLRIWNRGYPLISTGLPGIVGGELAIYLVPVRVSTIGGAADGVAAITGGWRRAAILRNLLRIRQRARRRRGGAVDPGTGPP